MTIPVDVVTVWAPRPSDPHWRNDYVKLLALQRDTALRFGHKHVVVTDAELDGFDTLFVPLGKELMPAMINGVIAYLLAKHDGHSDIVFVDADCLVARDLSDAFAEDDFDIGLTHREDPIAPINNGAMYIHRDADLAALDFFESAQALCGIHWGADQEAISAAAAPVPNKDCIEERNGVRFAFLSMRTHGVVPKVRGARHYSDPYIVHFKGETKAWAQEYADRYILPATE